MHKPCNGCLLLFFFFFESVLVDLMHLENDVLCATHSHMVVSQTASQRRRGQKLTESTLTLIVHFASTIMRRLTSMYDIYKACQFYLFAMRT